MNTSSGGLSCPLGSWLLAAGVGLLTAVLLLVIGNTSLMAALFLGAVALVLLGLLFTWLFCAPLPKAGEVKPGQDYGMRAVPPSQAGHGHGAAAAGAAGAVAVAGGAAAARAGGASGSAAAGSTGAASGAGGAGGGTAAGSASGAGSSAGGASSGGASETGAGGAGAGSASGAGSSEGETSSGAAGAGGDAAGSASGSGSSGSAGAGGAGAGRSGAAKAGTLAAGASGAAVAAAGGAAAGSNDGSLVKPTTALSGEADLAGRKGGWTYEGDGASSGSGSGSGSGPAGADGAAGSGSASAAGSSGAAASGSGSGSRAGGSAAAGSSGDIDRDGDGIIEGVNEGTRPEALSAARGGKPDDLKQIKGIGPKLEKLCHTLGFYHFDQIAGWTSDEVAWVDSNLEGFRGRVTRDNWVEQAKILAKGGETEFSKRVEDGDVY